MIENLLNGIICFILCILGYFLIYPIFKWSAGADTVFAKGLDATAGAAKPFFEKRKEALGEARKERMHAFKSGKLKSQGWEGAFGKTMFALGTTAGVAKEDLRFAPWKKDEHGKRHLWDAERLGSAKAGYAMRLGNEAYEKDEQARAMMAVDPYARAMGGRNKKHAQKLVEDHYIKQADLSADKAYADPNRTQSDEEIEADRQKAYAAAHETAVEAAEHVEANGGFSLARQVLSARALPESGTGLLNGRAGAAFWDITNHNKQIAQRLGGSGAAAKLGANLGGTQSKHAATGGIHTATLGAGTGIDAVGKALKGGYTIEDAAEDQRKQLRNRHTVNQILNDKPMSQEDYLSDLYNEYKDGIELGGSKGMKMQEKAYRDIVGYSANKQQANQSGVEIVNKYKGLVEGARAKHLADLNRTKEAAENSGDQVGAKRAQNALNEQTLLHNQAEQDARTFSGGRDAQQQEGVNQTVAG